MIEIKLAGVERVREFCRESGIPFQNDIQLYQAKQGSAPCGTIAFSSCGNESVIIALDAPDVLMADGLLRSALGYLLMQGCLAVKCLCAVDERILKRLHFSLSGENWVVALSESIFSCGCGLSVSTEPETPEGTAAELIE